MGGGYLPGWAAAGAFALCAVTAGAAQAQLAGTSWRLQSLDGGVVPRAAQPVTLSFAADGTVSGHDGCNGYWARYEARGREVRFIETMQTTVACRYRNDPLQEDRAHALMSFLNHTRYFRVDRTELRLETSDARASHWRAAPGRAEEGRHD